MLVTLLAPDVARAGDDIVPLRFRRMGLPRDVRFHFWGEGQAPRMQMFREVKVVRRTRNRSDNQHDCYWALTAAFESLADQARKIGANTVVDIRSNWKHQPGRTAGSFDCAIGNLMVGVALRGYAGRLAPAPAQIVAAPPPAAAPAPPQPGTVIEGRNAAGQTMYQMVLGDARAGAKFQSVPDAQPGQVKVAVALRAAGEVEKPHEACTVELEVAGIKEPLAAVRYQRSTGQETLFTELSLEQLRKLAAGGALAICTTRIAMGEASQKQLGQLLHAIDAHFARNRPVQPGEVLSL